MAKELSKTYKINLTKDNKANIEIFGEAVPVRKTEISILTQLFEMASNEQKTLKALNECLEIADRLENLTDDENELILSREDFKYLEKAIETSSGRRPAAWGKFRELFSQLANTEES